MAGLASLRRRRGRGDRGAEIIELAVVLPILLFVLAAIVDFAMLFQRYQTVTNAAREGARLAVLPGYSEDDVEARVQSYMVASGLTAAPNPVVTWRDVTLSTFAVIRIARVEVTYPAPLLYLGPLAQLVRGNQPGSVTLRAVTEMRAEPGAGMAGGS